MRDLFEMPADRSYFDAAHMGLLPKRSVVAGIEGLATRTRPWLPSGAVDLAELARTTFAGLVGGRADDIAIVLSTSYAMALAAHLLGARRGAVLVLEDEHPSQVLAWSGKRPVTTVARPLGGRWTEAVIHAIEPGTAVVCLPQCHWLDGAPIDLAAVGDAARRVGAALVVDATQSAGVRQIDIAEIRPDLLVASGYKWLLGPMGCAYLYVAPEHQQGRSIEDAFCARQPGYWFDGAGHVRYDPPMMAGARRFDAGGSINPIQLGIALAGVQTIADIGVAELEALLTIRNRALRERHPHLPFRDCATTHILSVEIDDPTRARDTLAAHNVTASIRGKLLRISGHAWNDDGDIAALDRALRALRHTS